MPDTSSICLICYATIPLGSESCPSCDEARAKAVPASTPPSAPPTYQQRTVTLQQAMRRYMADGWTEIAQLDVRAELASPEGTEHIYLEVQDDGTLVEQQRPTEQAGETPSSSSLVHRLKRGLLRR
ncbi:MAG: hypothetical protein ACR2PL_23395 [Dehalococcoidia bacterium]